MLSLLEQATEFFKQRYHAEISLIKQHGRNAYAECQNLYNIEFPGLLVPQSKLLKDRAEDFCIKCTNLVTIQEGSNLLLNDRVTNVSLLMKNTIPQFILASKEYLVNMHSPSHELFKQQQKDDYIGVVSCLDEINSILGHVQANFVNSFKEDVHATDQDLGGVSPTNFIPLQLHHLILRFPPNDYTFTCLLCT
eukprot:TRINITY_DN632_c0_g1_i2.p1 TRINITY_DN632_c0_g1~~TRINITY_DN632_c0_g1_i2.p1  ORF type:complete len:193 (-),score=38.56 TRINITY_DN632_c0_g1_i2:137-715(-)